MAEPRPTTKPTSNVRKTPPSRAAVARPRRREGQRVRWATTACTGGARNVGVGDSRPRQTVDRRNGVVARWTHGELSRRQRRRIVGGMPRSCTTAEFGPPAWMKCAGPRRHRTRVGHEHRSAAVVMHRGCAIARKQRGDMRGHRPCGMASRHDEFDSAGALPCGVKSCAVVARG